MADETIELTEVQEILDGLSSPTDEQLMQSVRGYSERAIGSAAAKLAMAGGGGGGSLPDWWTVDSTPGSETVEFAGEVHIRSDGDLFDALSVAEEWGLMVGGDGRTLVFSDPSVDGHTFDISGGPNGSASFRFLFTDSGLIEDLLQVWDDDDNQVAGIDPTGAVRISPSDDSSAALLITPNGAAAAFDVTGKPEIPASPSAQDIADALVALGLATQAA